MRLALPSLVLFVVPLACSFDSSGQPEAGSGADDQDDEADVTTATPESGGESGTDQGTSTTADTGTDEPGTTESTTDPTTESTTDPTTDPTTESTTDPTTDPTTESTTDTTESTTETTETTDTGMEGDPYGMCGACLPSEGCIDEFGLFPDWEVCYTPCSGDDDCPAAAGGEPVACVGYDFASRCFIDCSSQACPMGMACKSVNLGNDDICVFEK
jgi:hypothetical protein